VVHVFRVAELVFLARVRVHVQQDVNMGNTSVFYVNPDVIELQMDQLIVVYVQLERIPMDMGQLLVAHVGHLVVLMSTCVVQDLQSIYTCVLVQ
jgi:hypothetical protein